MEEDLPINDHVVIPGSELNFTASRSGGPGGQHVNKTSSKVTLSWNAASTRALDEPLRARIMKRLGSRLTNEGALRINVDEERSQHRNREIARRLLAEIVAAALVVPKKRVASRASKASKQRRLDEKRKRGAIKRQRSTPKDEG